MTPITREEFLCRLRRSKERKQESIREGMEFLRGIHYAETGVIAKDSEFIIW